MSEVVATAQQGLAGKYHPYPEYKDSGVEWLDTVPSHWDAKRLGQFLFERREKVSDKDYAALSVTKNGILPQLDTAAKSDAGDNRKLVKTGDFVINSRSDRKGSSGISERDGSVSLISIVMEPKGINHRYIHHLLRSYPFQEEFYRWGKGIVADLWSTNYSEMKNIILPIPTDTEQRTIAAFLDYETARIDRLIAQQQRLIELLKEKRQAVISHAVTKGINPDAPMKDSGVEWLGQVPKHWVVTYNKYLVQLTPKKSQITLDREQLCSFIPMEKLKQDTLILDEQRVIGDVFDGYTYFEDEDILLAKVTPCFENKNSVVARGLINGVGFGSTEIFVLRCNSQINNDFMYYRLQEGCFMDTATAAMTGAGGLKRVPSDVILNYKIALPPIEEQLAIVKALKNQLDACDKLIERAFSAIALTCTEP
ncbi:restriction endonuclease subunit S [Aeromonas media]|uniref:Restriction endonuclease subunit S n=1 Tax=Aeromonas media TaxID=651 RepID=A0AAE6VNS4_AERME|nr:restriction endonuclease subunit S [Aeromonas media]QHQ51514.1 restriction endonuclease subunit S [Aeromonas media]